MRKIITLAACLLIVATSRPAADACTNVIVTKGASADGSCMVTYAADSHQLFGELYFRPAAKWAKGSRLAIREWDTNKPMGEIAQVGKMRMPKPTYSARIINVSEGLRRVIIS